jgi:hypothetical protein
MRAASSMILDRRTARLHRSRKGKLAGVQRSLWGSAPNPEELAHLVVQEALAWPVGLDPFAIDYELRDGPLAHVPDKLFCGPGGGFDIDLGIGDLVLVEESFGLAAVAAPGSGINQHMHLLIIP